jgi:hypothetical protein
MARLSIQILTTTAHQFTPSFGSKTSDEKISDTRVSVPKISDTKHHTILAPSCQVWHVALSVDIDKRLRYNALGGESEPWPWEEL